MWRCVEEGALLWGRGCGDVWRKVRCGGRGRMGVEGRKFVGAWTMVRCGACGRMGVEGRKYAQTWAGVRRCVEEVVLLWVRWCG